MDVYDAINPLYIFTNLIGLSSYGFNSKKNDRKYIYSNCGFYHSFLVLILLLTFHYYGIAGRSSLELKFNSITGVADTVHLYGISVVVVFIFGFNYFRRSNIIKALNLMHSVDQQLMEFGCNLNYKLTKKVVTCFFVLAIIFLLAVECMNCSLFISTLRAYSSNCFLMCFSSLMIIMLEEFKFFTYFLLLKYRFKIINLLLRHHFPMNENEEIINYYKIYPKTPPKCDKEMMVKLRSLHLQLCFVGKLLNEYFSMQILLLIGFSFVGFTTNAYYSFDVIFDNFVNNDGNLGVIPSTVIWTATKFTELLFISVVCTITKNEANQTGEILYRIKNRYKKNVASQLHLFGKQIIHSNFKITAFDFFDIDMTLFFGVVGSATTYLTILIQFEIAAKGQFSNSTTVC